MLSFRQKKSDRRSLKNKSGHENTTPNYDLAGDVFPHPAKNKLD